jgi:hypothetical protein
MNKTMEVSKNGARSWATESRKIDTLTSGDTLHVQEQGSRFGGIFIESSMGSLYRGTLNDGTELVEVMCCHCRTISQ